MENYKRDHEQNELLIKRYDEVISQKSNKTSLLALEKKVKEKFAKKDYMENFEKESNTRYTQH